MKRPRCETSASGPFPVLSRVETGRPRRAGRAPLFVLVAYFIRRRAAPTCAGAGRGGRTDPLVRHTNRRAPFRRSAQRTPQPSHSPLRSTQRCGGNRGVREGTAPAPRAKASCDALGSACWRSGVSPAGYPLRRSSFAGRAARLRCPARTRVSCVGARVLAARRRCGSKPPGKSGQDVSSTGSSSPPAPHQTAETVPGPTSACGSNVGPGTESSLGDLLL